MQLRDTYYLVEGLLSAGKFDEAEERLVEVAENPQTYEEWACSFINTLVYSILIPQGRFREAYAWLDDSIQGDYGYESLNSISNLGHLMIKLGDLDYAEKLFRLLIDANTGPLDEAEEFLEMLESGEAENLIESTDDPTESKAYQHLYAYMQENGMEDDAVDAFNSSRGGAIHGFVKGVMDAEGISSLNPTNDQIAQLMWDFVTQEMLEPLPSYQDCVMAVDQQFADVEHRRVLREAAIQGSGEAAFLLAEAIRQEYDNENHLPWLNVARARGYNPGGGSSKNKSPRMF